MKKNQRTILIAALLGLALVLGGCSGEGFIPTSWPGVTLSPTGNALYVASNQGIYRVSQAGGQQELAYPSDAIRGATYFAAPTLTEDGQLLAAAYNNHLYSFDVVTRTLRWDFNQARSRFIASPLVLDGVIYAPNADGTLYALDLNGELLAEFQTEDGLWAAPATDGTLIYLTSMDGFVYALRPGTLAEVWRAEAGAAIVSTPVLDSEGGLLYVGTFNGDLLGFNLRNGGREFEARASGWIWGPPALADGVLYVGDLNGALFAFDAGGSGTALWTLQLAGQIAGAPLVTADGLYIGTSEGNFYAVTLDGSLRFTKTVEDAKLLGTPTLLGDLIVVGSSGDNVLLAYNANGAVQWEFTPEK